MRRLFGWVTVVTILGCSRSSTVTTHSSAGTVATRRNGPVAPLTLPESLPAIPAHPIRWSVAGVVTRLREINLDVEVTPATVRESFLAPPEANVVVHSSAADSADVLV